MTRPLLALHALFMHSASMTPMGEALGREVIAPSLPGHRRGPPWLEAQDYIAQAVEGACAALPEGQVDVFGHSLGATVALQLAVARPGQVRSLVVFEPAFFAAAGPDALAIYRNTMNAVIDALAKGREGTAAASFHALWGTGATWEDLPATLRKSMIRMMPIVPATGPSVMDDSEGLLPRLRDCPVPVLILQQEQPLEIMAALCEGLRQRLPNAQVRSVAGAGRHMLPVTDPVAVAGAVRAFWATLP
jgi:pimeloyl-ACP methyl ester carboxylesterase